MLLPPTGRRFGHVFWPTITGLAFLWLLIAFVIRNPWAFKLDLGSQQAPTVRYGYFAAFSTLFSVMAAGFLAAAFARHITLRKTRASIGRVWSTGAHAPWLLAASALGIAVPFVLRFYLVGPAPLFDEEHAHLFMAELLAEGKLVGAPFPDFKHFRQFPSIHVGDRVVPEVLLGWPILLVPGVWLGQPGWIAPVIGGLGVVPVYLSGTRLLGRGWGRVASALYILSPMITLAAVTRLPHAASLTLLAWMLWFTLRSRDDNPAAWTHFGVLGCFLWALNIHPGPALALGIPLLLSWLWHQLRRFDSTTLIAVCSLLIVTALGIFLFRTVNEVQTGRAAVPAIGMRFLEAKPRGTREIWRQIVAASWVLPAWKDAVARLAMAGFRMNLDLFGWALSLLFVPFAITGGRRWGVLWAMVACGALMQLFRPRVGHDVFGPANVFELALPLLLLTTAGLKSLTEALAGTRASTHPGLDATVVPICLVFGLVISAIPAYWFPRLAAVQRAAVSAYKPIREFRRARLTDAIVFGPTHYIQPRCREGPTKLYVTKMPPPRPDSDVWWLPRNFRRQMLRMAEEFPERSVWQARWTKNCGFEFTPLDPDSGLEGFRTAGDPLDLVESLNALGGIKTKPSRPDKKVQRTTPRATDRPAKAPPKERSAPRPDPKPKAPKPPA